MEASRAEKQQMLSAFDLLLLLLWLHPPPGASPPIRDSQAAAVVCLCVSSPPPLLLLVLRCGSCSAGSIQLGAAGRVKEEIRWMMVAELQLRLIDLLRSF